MPHNHEWQSRIKAVEREYLAMRQAADRFRQAAHDDPTILREDLRHREIVAASANLEGTYVIRRKIVGQRKIVGRKIVEEDSGTFLNIGRK